MSAHPNPHRLLSRRQEKGLRKVGQLLIPGGQGLPSFENALSWVHFDRVGGGLTAADLSGLQFILSLFSYFPNWFLKAFFEFFEWWSKKPSGGIARLLTLGLKGVVFTLYYADFTADGGIHKTIGWDTQVSTPDKAGVDAQTPAQKAFAQARRAQVALSRISIDDRLVFIERFKSVIVKRREEIVKRVIEATGKSATDALMSEILAVLDHFDTLKSQSKRYLSDRKVKTPLALLGKKSEVVFEPLGTILVISPWNYPFYQAVVPVTQAWACGNTVVYKPSEWTPLEGLLESLLQEAEIPKGWLEVVYGDGTVGQELLAQKPDKVFFTGSTRTGQRIMSAASQALIPIELELGGKDPMLVFEDVNIARAARGALWGGVTNLGQSCTSVERIYVQDTIHDAFCEELSTQARLVSREERGRMTTPFQVQIIREHLEDALEKGAQLLTGHEWDRQSPAIPPLVLVGVDHTMKVMTEESFGPFLPVCAFSSEEQAVRLANDSPYGLSASVWSHCLLRARRVARALHTGNVTVNNVMLTEGNHALPFGGVGQSGFGRFKGEFGFYAFSNAKALLTDADSRKVEANWFPYTENKYKLFDELVVGTAQGGLLGFVRFAWAGLRLESLAGKCPQNPKVFYRVPLSQSEAAASIPPGGSH